MPPLPFSRPLIKISGEALMGKETYGVDTSTLNAIASDICDLMNSGIEPALVVGGGNIFRGVAGVAQGMGRVKSDFMGMLATVMNAIALQDAFSKAGRAARIYSGLPVPTICDSFDRDRALADLDAGRAVILAGGTGSPFFTTDTAAALRAAELDCDVMMKATQVDGIYTSDPKQDPSARRYDRLTFSEVLTKDLKVMDAAAIALARDNNIPVVVFSLHEDGAIGKVMRGQAVCTMVAN